MLGYWHEAVRDADVSLDIKTCDLRKACKQLCVSSNALADTYLAVWNPHLRKTEVYGQYALPFGSCASVHAFCRSSLALWRIGISRMRFDDFVIFSRPALSRHTEFSLRFFSRQSAGPLHPTKSLSEAKFHVTTIHNTEDRRNELRETIDAVLEPGTLSVADGQRFRGRLIFARLVGFRSPAKVKRVN